MTARVRLSIVSSPVAELVGREIELGAEELLIGRADDCGLPVADASMSRRHARVVAGPGGARVVDNGSANGVHVDGDRVAEAALGAGRRFTLGQAVFEVLVEVPAPVAAPAAAAAPEAPAEAPIERTMSIADIAELVRQIERPKSFEEEGERIVTAANRPLVLSDPDAVWLVESGKIEIFTVALENGQPVGARTHFVTVEPGELFFGM